MAPSSGCSSEHAKLAVSQAQLSSTEEDVRQRQEREDKREAELGALKTQHQDLVHVRDSMIAERDRLAAEVAAETQRATQARESLQAQLDAAESSLDALQAQAAGLRDELKAKAEALASTSAVVQDKESEVAVLAAKLREQQERKDAADSESKLALEALTKDCEAAAAANKALESDNKELAWKTEAQDEKIADLKAQLAASQLQLEERRKDLDKREGEKEEARLEVRNAFRRTLSSEYVWWMRSVADMCDCCRRWRASRLSAICRCVCVCVCVCVSSYACCTRSLTHSHSHSLPHSLTHALTHRITHTHTHTRFAGGQA